MDTLEQQQEDAELNAAQETEETAGDADAPAARCGADTYSVRENQAKILLKEENSGSLGVFQWDPPLESKEGESKGEKK